MDTLKGLFCQMSASFRFPDKGTSKTLEFWNPSNRMKCTRQSITLLQSLFRSKRLKMRQQDRTSLKTRMWLEAHTENGFDIFFPNFQTTWLLAKHDTLTWWCTSPLSQWSKKINWIGNSQVNGWGEVNRFPGLHALWIQLSATNLCGENLKIMFTTIVLRP